MNTLLGKLALVAAVAGMVLLGWGLWPPPRHAYAAELGPARVVFTVPTAMHLGDALVARLEVFPAAASPSPEASNAPPLRQLAARLTFNGMQVEPPGEVNLTLGQKAPARLTWRLKALTVGDDVGSFWMYQVFPDGSRRARLSYPLHLQVSTFLGLSSSEARLLGLFAVFVAAVLAFAARRQ